MNMFYQYSKIIFMWFYQNCIGNWDEPHALSIFLVQMQIVLILQLLLLFSYYNDV
jgi:hypothetical protein